MNWRPLLVSLQVSLRRISTTLERPFDADSARPALRDACNELRTIAHRRDDLWDHLILAATADIPSNELTESEMFLGALGATMERGVAVFLQHCGYKSPPPPTAHELVSGVRAVLEQRPDRGPNSDQTTRHVEHSRERLFVFARETIKHIPQAEPDWLKRRLLLAREQTAGLIIVLTVINPEVQTGKEFDFGVAVSPSQLVSLKFTVPAPWNLSSTPESLISSCAIEVADQTGALMSSPEAEAIVDEIRSPDRNPDRSFDDGPESGPDEFGPESGPDDWSPDDGPDGPDRSGPDSGPDGWTGPETGNY